MSTLVIERGLLPRMVLQRDGKAAQKAMVLGRCRASGKVRATVSAAGGAPLRGWADRAVGAAAGGRFEATLAGLPVGGPYDVVLRCGDDSARVRDVLVGDVWLLAGQSNMQGCGHFPARRLGRDPLVRASCLDARWRVAADPIHDVSKAVEACHLEFGGRRGPDDRPGPPPPYLGVGPGVSFGQAMRSRTGVPQGLLATAHGATSTDDWDPARKRLGERSFYGAAIARFEACYPGGTIAGLLWYQGCGDTGAQASARYMAKTARIVRAFRRDLRSPGLPVVLVQIGNVVGPAEPAEERGWSAVREAQRVLGETLPRAATVPAVDLELDEGIHLSGTAQYELGRRMAEAAESIRRAGERGAPKRPVALESVETGTYEDGRAVVTARFRDVSGRLVADGRPTGFAIDDGTGYVGSVTNVRLDGDKAVILTTTTPRLLAHGGCALWYGFGRNPYCNIRDEAGRPLPAFGPVYFGAPYRTTSDYMTFDTCRASEFLPASAALAAETEPPDPAGLRWIPRGSLPDVRDFCDIHGLAGLRRGRDEVVYFRAVFRCDDDWRLNLLFGYDGPVRAWMDGEEVLHDPSGDNPGYPDRAVAPVRAARGDHEVLFALGTNGGKAWGVFLRLERTAVPRRETAGGRRPRLPRFLRNEELPGTFGGGTAGGGAPPPGETAG